MKTALSIAGTDPTGGAGIQADLKTMTMNGVYAMSAITALVVQNTTGVSEFVEAKPDFLRRQLDAVFTDIFPDAVKTGMVASSGLIEIIADRLQFYGAGNPGRIPYPKPGGDGKGRRVHRGGLRLRHPPQRRAQRQRCG